MRGGEGGGNRTREDARRRGDVGGPEARRRLGCPCALGLALLTGCGATPEEEVNALVLAAGVLAGDVIRGTSPVAYGSEEPEGVWLIEASTPGAWEGVVRAELSAGGVLTGDCGGGPCDTVWTASCGLEDVTVHHAGRARASVLDPPPYHVEGRLRLVMGLQDHGDAGVLRVETVDPALLHARGSWIDREAAVTLAYDERYETYGGELQVRGTVDGVAAGYDAAWED